MRNITKRNLTLITIGAKRVKQFDPSLKIRTLDLKSNTLSLMMKLLLLNFFLFYCYDSIL